MHAVVHNAHLDTDSDYGRVSDRLTRSGHGWSTGPGHCAIVGTFHKTLSHVHGDPLIGQKRCIALNATHVTIADSYISECKSTTQDSQAIAGWNGPGPYTIENNYLEAAGENVMIGGSDPSITDLVPSDIVCS